MRNRLRIGLTILLVAMLGALIWQVSRSREPVYQGRTLNSWLAQYASNNPAIPVSTPPPESVKLSDEAKMAIQQIGTNVIPALVSMASAHDSPLASNIIVQVRKLTPFRPRPEDENHSRAVLGFYALGSQGKDAVPSLIALLKSHEPRIQLTAMDCLGNIGPPAKDAVPLLVTFVNDTNQFMPWDALINLGRIHSEPELVVPILVTNLNTSNKTILGVTIFVLGQYGTNAKPAFSVLLPYLNNMDGYVRYKTSNALVEIDHEAAAQAGVR